MGDPTGTKGIWLERVKSRQLQEFQYLGSENGRSIDDIESRIAFIKMAFNEK